MSTNINYMPVLKSKLKKVFNRCFCKKEMLVAMVQYAVYSLSTKYSSCCNLYYFWDFQLMTWQVIGITSCCNYFHKNFGIVYSDSNLKGSFCFEMANFAFLNPISWYKTNENADIVFSKPNQILSRKKNCTCQTHKLGEPTLAKHKGL